MERKKRLEREIEMTVKKRVKNKIVSNDIILVLLL